MDHATIQQPLQAQYLEERSSYLLKHKVPQGTEDVVEKIKRVPGVPDLTNMININIMLLDIDMIEKDKLHKDALVTTYWPSAAALDQSNQAV